MVSKNNISYYVARVIGWFTCHLRGNHIPSPKFTQSGNGYYTRACRRCGVPLGVPRMVKVPKPPGSHFTREQWIRYCERRVAKVKMIVEILKDRI